MRSKLALAFSAWAAALFLVTGIALSSDCELMITSWYEGLVPPGGPVVLELRLENKSERPCEVRFDGSTAEGIVLTVRTPEGGKRKAIPSGGAERRGLKMGGASTLASGEALEAAVLVSDLVPFEERGNFEISVALRDVCGLGQAAESNKIRLTVADKMGHKDLEPICDLLAARAVGGPVQEALVAARALSQVSGDSCIPQLLSTLDSRPVGLGHVVDRLLRSGEDNIRRSVTDVWKSLSVLEKSQALGQIESAEAREILINAE